MKDGVADVFLIGEDLLDVTFMPPDMPSSVCDAITLQGAFDLKKALAADVLPVYPLHHLGLERVNDEVSIFVLGVSQKPIMIDLDFPLLVSKL
ncbi:hypothetical protein [Proteiniclasticum sp. QWL-01]|uniref:hypothetical protein n=1 Tax=Proteiniclasticum sp. QWL-01 TaxID=3036945 RepID=UPI0024111710|nr:hypothetical protein [Proteiniclasticum sp. QWL-01]WFF73694.1 hypothetical protein P6M73_04415 [Proteiniclasticum sp. QWL-01]